MELCWRISMVAVRADVNWNGTALSAEVNAGITVLSESMPLNSTEQFCLLPGAMPILAVIASTADVSAIFIPLNENVLADGIPTPTIPSTLATPVTSAGPFYSIISNFDILVVICIGSNNDFRWMPKWSYFNFFMWRRKSKLLYSLWKLQFVLHVYRILDSLCHFYFVYLQWGGPLCTCTMCVSKEKNLILKYKKFENYGIFKKKLF